MNFQPEFFPSISVIIPVLNGEDVLDRCLTCLEEQTYPPERYEIIVVDNGSTDATAAIAQAHRVKYHYFSAAKGAPASRNHALRQATGDIYLFTDCDCYAPRDLLLRHARQHLFFQAADPSIQAVGGGIRGINQGFWALCDDICSWSYFHYKLPPRIEKLFCPTANISFLSSVFSAIGSFDERLLYGDDLDICRRLQEAGGQVFFDSQAYTCHVNRPSLRGFVRHIEHWASGYGYLLEAGIRKPRTNTIPYFLGRSIFRLLGTHYLALRSKRWYSPLLFPILFFAFLLDGILIAKTELNYKRRQRWSNPS